MSDSSEPVEAHIPPAGSLKVLLFNGSSSVWEDKDRTEDQLIPRSSSASWSAVCLKAELKSLSGASKE